MKTLKMHSLIFGLLCGVVLGATLYASHAAAHGVEERTLLAWIREACYDIDQATGQAWDRLPRDAKMDFKRQIHDSYTADGLRGQLTRQHVAAEVNARSSSIRPNRFDGRRGRGKRFRALGTGIAIGTVAVIAIEAARNGGPNLDTVVDLGLVGAQFIPVVGQLVSFYMIAATITDAAVEAIVASMDEERRAWTRTVLKSWYYTQETANVVLNEASVRQFYEELGSTTVVSEYSPARMVACRTAAVQAAQPTALRDPNELSRALASPADRERGYWVRGLGEIVRLPAQSAAFRARIRDTYLACIGGVGDFAAAGPAFHIQAPPMCQAPAQ